MALILPNTIANDIPADGDKLGQNFDTIQDWANQDAITADGSTGMTAPLLLPGPPTQPDQAATKGYVDSATSWIGKTTSVTGNVTSITNGNSAVTAMISDVAVGSYMAYYGVLVGGDEEMIYTARLFLNAVSVFSTVHRGRTSSLLLVSNVVVTTAASTVAVDLVNGASPLVATYADPTNHRFTLVRGQ